MKYGKVYADGKKVEAKRNLPLKAVGYIRISEKDEEKPLESLENQKKLITQYCMQNSLELVKFYTDIEKKGWKANRPEFDLMKEEINTFDVVLIKNWSRLARGISIQEDAVAFFESKGKKIIPTNDVLDKKARQITGLTNEWYIDDLRANIESIHKMKLNENIILSPPPFGYKKIKKIVDNKVVFEKKKWAIDNEKAKIIEQIFKLFDSGMHIKDIASKHGFEPRRVNRILKNDSYIGNIHYRDIVFKGVNKPIVSKELFEKVRIKLR